MRRRDVLIRLGLVAGGLGGAWWFRDHVLWRGPKATFAGGQATDWMAYAERRAATPTVEVRINGRAVRALVDSGAEYSVMDRALYRDMGLTDAFNMPLVAYGVGGDAQVGRGTHLDVEIGGLRLEGLRAAILNLGPLAQDRGLGASLILGQDVLHTLVLELDTERRRLRFLPREAYVPPQGAASVEVTRFGKAMQVEATVEGHAVNAVVDTGASAVLALTRGAAEGAGLLDGRPLGSGDSIVLGGIVPAQSATVRELTIGGRPYRDVQVAIYQDVAVPGFPRALIGMAAFEGGRLAMDLAGGRLYASRPMDITVEGPVRPR